MPNCWYVYVGSGDFTDPSRYVKTNVFPTCTVGRNLCAIFTGDCGQTPTGPFSATLQSQIADAIASGQPQPAPPVGPPYVVVMRP